MKKLFLSYFLFFLLIGYTFSQITIADGNGNDLTDNTAFLPVSPQKVNFFITNQSATEITFIVQVVSYTLPEDAGDILVCACGNCLPVSLQTPPFTVGDPTVLAPGATDNSLSDVEYNANGSTAPANITIKVFEQGNETNAAQFTLDTEYIAGIKKIQNNNIFSIFPNPTNGYFTISSNQNYSDSELVFSNILGKTIKRVDIDNKQIQLNSKEFSKGIYFVSLIKKNKVLSTMKLVIN